MTNKAQRLAKRLLKQNRKNGRSWRVIACEDYQNLVNFATLNRFANSGGEWLPKDESILTALGLITPKQPRRIRLPKWFNRTPEAEQWFERQRQNVKGMSQDTREVMRRKK